MDGRDARHDPFPSPAAFNRLPGELDVKGNGFAGGVHLGYNWQFAPSWVVGIEGDWQFTGIDASEQDPIRNAAGAIFNANQFTTLSRDVDWLASARARLGFAWDRVLVYATGGIAWGKFDYFGYTESVPPAAVWTTSIDSVKTGCVLGGGLEWAFTKNWLLRVEYLFYRFPGVDQIITASPVFPGFDIGYTWDDATIQIVRAGLTFKF